MSMNKADILVDCILSEIDDKRVTEWVHELSDLADPQATLLRAKEREIDELREVFKGLVSCTISEGGILLASVDKYNQMVELFNSSRGKING